MKRRTRTTLGPGSLLGGRYEVEGLLGIGGMATVYRARDIQLNRHVAVKTLDSRMMGADSVEVARERFFREARAMAAIDSPHVVPIYDVGSEGARVFMVEKLLSGVGLDELIEGQALTYKAILGLVNDVLAGLQAVHLAGLVHRDVKPSNVFVSGERAILIDLGIALGEEGDRLTGRHLVVGTPEFMSPEQAMGDEATAHSDIYSLGLMLLYLTCGRGDLEERDTSIGVRIGGDDWLDAALGSVPAPLHQVLRRALAMAPTRRFSSALDMRTALLVLPELRRGGFRHLQALS